MWIFATNMWQPCGFFIFGYRLSLLKVQRQESFFVRFWFTIFKKNVDDPEICCVLFSLFFKSSKYFPFCLWYISTSFAWEIDEISLLTFVSIDQTVGQIFELKFHQQLVNGSTLSVAVQPDNT